MSHGLNKVIIIGYLGRDPEMRYTPSGRPVTTFSVATSRQWTGEDNEPHSETEWFNVVVWGNLAETCKNTLSKGKRIYIEGRLQSRQWEDKDGNKRKSIEIVASEMILLSERKSSSDEEKDLSFDEGPTDYLS